MKRLILWFEDNSDITWIVVIGIMVIIFVLSEFSEIGTPTKKSLGLFSITYHFFAFFFLNAFLLMALVRGRRKEFIFVAIIISIFYGILDEVHQFFVPGRVSGFFDVMTNNAGIFFSTVIYMISLRSGRN